MTSRFLIAAATIFLLLVSPSSRLAAAGGGETALVRAGDAMEAAWVQTGDDGETAQPHDTICAGSIAADSMQLPGAISAAPVATDPVSSRGEIAAAPVAVDSARVRLLNPYWYSRPAAATTLNFYAGHPALDSRRMLGYESYRASQGECALRGAAIGSTIGMNIAALGLMTGKLDQKEGWIIGGALTTLGIIYGGIFKADDPKWYNRIRIGASGGK